MQPPVKSMDELWSPEVEQYVMQMLSASFIGSKATLQEDLGAFLAQTQANEIMATSHVFSHEARIHSYELLAETMQVIGQPQATGQLVAS
jgi:alkanesulfonate monooxygenase SsuD/methylene tetrahydromethanopterin reductase-like flavin-dependent oxidoreductase (luciferase family)